MVHSSRNSFISILLKISVKTKAPAAIIIFLALLTPRLWGDDRKEYINMDGKALAVESGAVVCGPYAVSPTSRTVDKAGGIRNVTVHGGESGCFWEATSNVSWIKDVSGGGDNGNVTYRVEPNISPERTGTLTVAGQTVTVKQASGCDPSFSTTYGNIDFVGGTRSVNVSSGSGCKWTATSADSSWITITGGSGTGNGTVNYTVAANPGGQRSGTITIGNKAFTITQGEHCQMECSSQYSQCPETAQSACLSRCIEEINCNPGIGACIDIVGNCVSGCVADQQRICYGEARECQTACNNACGYTLSSTGASISSGGMSGTVNVSSAACAWTAVSNASWIKLSAGTSGTGNGTVGYTVSGNPGVQRNGTITIAGETFKITQADGCAYGISSTSASPAVGGGRYSVEVTGSDASCTPTATNVPAWITNVTVSGSGTVKTVSYTVSANVNPTRTATMTIAGKPFAVTQPNGCTHTISPTSASQAAGAGSGSVSVSSSGGSCPWTTTNNASSWITITGGGGTGNGTVSYTAAANNGPARTGTITIAGKTFTVNQANGCTYDISPISASQAADAGSGSVSVTSSNASCPWTTTNNSSSLITVTGGSSGTGNGTVSYSVSGNTGTDIRTGTLTIAGKTFTVTQAACTYSINPTGSGTIGINGGSGSFTVNASNSACTWTAANNASYFVTITGGGSGTGNGTVSYSVASNSNGPPRRGTITAGGQSFTVSQAGVACQNLCVAEWNACSAEASMCPVQCSAAGMECGGPGLPHCSILYLECLSECSYLQPGCDSDYNRCLARCQ